MIHPDGQPFDHYHDGLGRLQYLYRNYGPQLARFTYRASGLPEYVARYGSTATYVQDGAGRLERLIQDLAGTGSDEDLRFAYNPASQVASRASANDAYAWRGAVAVNRPYSVNGQNQYTAVGPAAFAYDANGNLTSDGSTAFVYDVENRLVSASGERGKSGTVTNFALPHRPPSGAGCALGVAGELPIVFDYGSGRRRPGPLRRELRVYP